MAELGAISSHILGIQQLQMSLIKNAAEMQQKMIETLLGDSASVVPPSDHLGLNVDVSI